MVTVVVPPAQASALAFKVTVLMPCGHSTGATKHPVPHRRSLTGSVRSGWDRFPANSYLSDGSLGRLAAACSTGRLPGLRWR
jgi:hypothetical protein